MIDCKRKISKLPIKFHVLLTQFWYSSIYLSCYQSQIKHVRAINFHAANLNFNEGQGSSTQTSGIVVSITNSLNTGEAAAYQFSGMNIIIYH